MRKDTIEGKSEPAESTQHLTDAGEVINHPSRTLQGMLVGLWVATRSTTAADTFSYLATPRAYVTV
jgi:hypothetical protein